MNGHARRVDLGAGLALLSAGMIALALALIFFWVPNDADQGFSQRIFYFHVPIALTTYALFAWGAVNAARYLWTGRDELDLRSYVPMHLGVIFGTLTLVTGSFWAKVSWGVWWYWGSRELNSFLIIYLFYCAYFMLRFSIEPGERRARFSAVYALAGVGLVPISVLAVHLAQNEFHPVVFSSTGAAMENSMLLTFVVSLAAMLCLAVTFYVLELRGKLVDEHVRRIGRLVQERA